MHGDRVGKFGEFSRRTCWHSIKGGIQEDSVLAVPAVKQKHVSSFHFLGHGGHIMMKTEHAADNKAHAFIDLRKHFKEIQIVKITVFTCVKPVLV